jgi:ribosomal protein S27E
MPIQVNCKSCKAKLKLGDHLAGKKIKCPKCATVLLVPKPEDEEEREQRFSEAPIASPKKKAKIAVDEDEEDQDERPRGKKDRAPVKDGFKSTKARNRQVEDDDDDDAPRKKKKGKKTKYQDCPQCGASDPARVLWTPWGSFYGPAMLSHVRCTECNHHYNGRTGGSNTLGIVVFVTMPLIGIICLIGAIFYVLYTRNYLKF